MNSMERVMTAMGHREPDKVPLFLLTTMHGAREVGLTIPEYYSDPANVVEGQMRLLAKYRGDCVAPLGYVSAEAEAFGVETRFIEDGPPNAGSPSIRRPSDIDALVPPRIAESPALMRGLEIIRGLKARVGETVPIMGLVTSPFSLPIMQMGFEHYLDLLFTDSRRFERLMAVNKVFCVEWANAQLAAGATAIGYADPMSSTTTIPREFYLESGFRIACDTLPKIKGAAAVHLASGRGLAIAEEIVASGAAAIGVSALEDLSEWKRRVGGRVSIVGNLNGIEMRRWSAQKAEEEVKRAIAKAGRGGGFVLADNHGEIPWQVPDEVLLAIREAADRWGRYPLDWVE